MKSHDTGALFRGMVIAFPYTSVGKHTIEIIPIRIAYTGIAERSVHAGLNPLLKEIVYVFAVYLILILLPDLENGECDVSGHLGIQFLLQSLEYFIGFEIVFCIIESQTDRRMTSYKVDVVQSAVVCRVLT